MCVLLITRMLRGVGKWARKPVNHTSWVAVVTPTDRPKSVHNRCLIELFCGVVFVVALPFWHFYWCRGFCHRVGSDLLLFVFVHPLRFLEFIRFVEKNCFFLRTMGKGNIVKMPWVPQGGIVLDQTGTCTTWLCIHMQHYFSYICGGT